MAGEDKDQESPPVKAEKKNRIKNLAMAGKRVFGVSGSPIDFDDKGLAPVSGADFDHLATVPGYEKA